MPSSSGPRCTSAAHIRSTSARSTGRPCASIFPAIPHMFRVPRHRLLDSFAERRARAEADLALGARDVEHPPRLPVRLRRVPGDVAAEAGLLPNQLSEFVDGDFLSAPEVHRLRLLISLGGEEDSL